MPWLAAHVDESGEILRLELELLLQADSHRRQALRSVCGPIETKGKAQEIRVNHYPIPVLGNFLQACDPSPQKLDSPSSGMFGCYLT